MIAGIFGPHQIRLQAYMVPIVTEIAGIFVPLLNQDCMHSWSLSSPRLQAYLVPFTTKIASIIVPPPIDKVIRAILQFERVEVDFEIDLFHTIWIFNYVFVQSGDCSFICNIQFPTHFLTGFELSKSKILISVLELSITDLKAGMFLTTQFRSVGTFELSLLARHPICTNSQFLLQPF